MSKSAIEKPMLWYARKFPWMDLEEGILELPGQIRKTARKGNADGCFFLSKFNEKIREQESFLWGKNFQCRSDPWIRASSAEKLIEALQQKAEELEANGCFFIRRLEREKGGSQFLCVTFGKTWSPEKLSEMRESYSCNLGRFDIQHVISPPFLVLEEDGEITLQPIN